MINFINNSVASYGAPAVVAAAVVVGMLSYPIIKKITTVAYQALQTMVKWIVDSTFIIRMRSLGCDQCAEHHSSHIDTLNIIHRVHERQSGAAT